MPNISPSQDHAAPAAPNVTDENLRANSTGRIPSGSRRQRRERNQNWQVAETLVLIQAKRTQHFREKNMIDPRDLMIPEVTKWSLIGQEVTQAGHSPCIRDGPASKVKWNQLQTDYKRVADYHNRSGQNVQDFWDPLKISVNMQDCQTSFPRSSMLLCMNGS